MKASVFGSKFLLLLLAMAALLLVFLMMPRLWSSSKDVSLIYPVRPVALADTSFLTMRELTVILFPHCGREAFAKVLVQELSQFLAPLKQPFLILGVQQLDTPDALQRYCKGLSWNVAFCWLESQGAGPNLALALQDVDAIPRHNVSYECPPMGQAEVWWQTTGGIKLRFGDALRVNGYPVSAKGWGREDQDFWLRLKRAEVELREWPHSLSPEDPAVVLNLEWMSEAEESFLRQYYWGSWMDRVHVVAQQNRTWGLTTTVPVPTKTWFSPETFDRNRRLSDLINQLGDESFWDHICHDGMRSLKFLSPPVLNSFFDSIPMPPSVLSLNLTFQLKDVQLDDGLSRRENLLWYAQEPLKCSSNQDCPVSLSCEDHQCLWPYLET